MRIIPVEPDMDGAAAPGVGRKSETKQTASQNILLFAILTVVVPQSRF
jgi:hypothetical protein